MTWDLVTLVMGQISGSDHKILNFLLRALDQQFAPDLEEKQTQSVLCCTLSKVGTFTPQLSWQSWNSNILSLARASSTGAFSNTKLVPTLLKKTPRKLSCLTLLILDCQEEKRQQRWSCHFPLSPAWKIMDLAIWKFWLKKTLWVLLGCHVIAQLHLWGK